MKAVPATKIEAALVDAQQRIDEMSQIPEDDIVRDEETRRVMSEIRQLSTDALRIVMTETVLAMSEKNLVKPEANERIEVKG